MKSVEDQWQEFAAAVGVPVGGVQWTETRRAFYAGSITMLSEVSNMSGSDADCIRQLEEIHREHVAWTEGIGKGSR